MNNFWIHPFWNISEDRTKKKTAVWITLRGLQFQITHQHHCITVSWRILHEILFSLISNCSVQNTTKMDVTLALTMDPSLQKRHRKELRCMKESISKELKFSQTWISSLERWYFQRKKLANRNGDVVSGDYFDLRYHIRRVHDFATWWGWNTPASTILVVKTWRALTPKHSIVKNNPSKNNFKK